MDQSITSLFVVFLRLEVWGCDPGWRSSPISLIKIQIVHIMLLPTTLWMNDIWKLTCGPYWVSCPSLMYTILHCEAQTFNCRNNMMERPKSNTHFWTDEETTVVLHCHFEVHRWEENKKWRFIQKGGSENVGSRLHEDPRAGPSLVEELQEGIPWCQM